MIPGGSLRETLKEFDAVITVRVLRRAGTRVIDERNLELPLTGPNYRVYTEYDVLSTELLKVHPAVTGSSLRIATLGGTAQVDDLIIQQEPAGGRDSPQLIEGRSYLLMLTFSKPLNEMQLWPIGMFDISGPAVVGEMGRTRYGKELISLPSAEALRKIKAILAASPR